MNRYERTRQIIVYMLYLLSLSVIQVTFADVFSLFGHSADFTFVFAVLAGYFFGIHDGVVIGLVTGLLRDFFSGQTLGIGILIFLYVGILSATLFRIRFHRRISLAFVQVLLLTFLYKFFGHSILMVFNLFSTRGGDYLTQSEIWLNSILPQMILNVLATAPLVILIYFLGPYNTKIRNERAVAAPGEDILWQRN